jgi:MFS family permease
MPRGFLLLIAAQFTSALADNALLIVAIALLQQQGLPGWWAPLLKFSFTLSYVLLAPVVGPLADALPKARLMAWMNALKMLGLGGMLLPLHPVAAYAVVGLGAAGYAPAKYGLVTELVPPHQLVAANGWIEVSIVCAALLGTVLGGGLVSAPMLALGLNVSLGLLLGLYGLAALLQWGVPDSGARYPGRPGTRWRWRATSGPPTGACGAMRPVACRWR